MSPVNFTASIQRARSAIVNSISCHHKYLLFSIVFTLTSAAPVFWKIIVLVAVRYNTFISQLFNFECFPSPSWMLQLFFILNAVKVSLLWGRGDFKQVIVESAKFQSCDSLVLNIVQGADSTPIQTNRSYKERHLQLIVLLLNLILDVQNLI